MLLIGLDGALVYDEPTFNLGSYGEQPDDSSEFIFVLFADTVEVGSVCQVSTSHVAALLSTANAQIGSRVGVALVPATIGQYGWVQVRGTPLIRVAAGTNGDSTLNTTNTPGVLSATRALNSYTLSGMATILDNVGPDQAMAGVMVDPQVDNLVGVTVPVTINGVATLGTSVEMDPIVSNGTIAATAHNLPSAPHTYIVILECLTAEHGYSVGDQVAYGPQPDRVSIRATATEYAVKLRQTPWIAYVSSDAGNTLTAANWKMTITPVLYQNVTIQDPSNPQRTVSISSGVVDGIRLTLTQTASNYEIGLAASVFGNLYAVLTATNAAPDAAAIQAVTPTTTGRFDVGPVTQGQYLHFVTQHNDITAILDEGSDGPFDLSQTPTGIMLSGVQYYIYTSFIGLNAYTGTREWTLERG